MKIGITIGLLKDNESLWINGIKLNALYLAKTLQCIEEHEALQACAIVGELTDAVKNQVYDFFALRYRVESHPQISQFGILKNP